MLIPVCILIVSVPGTIIAGTLYARIALAADRPAPKHRAGR